MDVKFKSHMPLVLQNQRVRIKLLAQKISEEIVHLVNENFDLTPYGIMCA